MGIPISRLSNIRRGWRRTALTSPCIRAKMALQPLRLRSDKTILKYLLAWNTSLHN